MRASLGKPCEIDRILPYVNSFAFSAILRPTAMMRSLRQQRIGLRSCGEWEWVRHVVHDITPCDRVPSMHEEERRMM